MLRTDDGLCSFRDEYAYCRYVKFGRPRQSSGAQFEWNPGRRIMCHRKIIPDIQWQLTEFRIVDDAVEPDMSDLRSGIESRELGSGDPDVHIVTIRMAVCLQPAEPCVLVTSDCALLRDLRKFRRGFSIGIFIRRKHAEQRAEFTGAMDRRCVSRVDAEQDHVRRLQAASSPRDRKPPASHFDVHSESRSIPCDPKLKRMLLLVDCRRNKHLMRRIQAEKSASAARNGRFLTNTQ